MISIPASEVRAGTRIELATGTVIVREFYAAHGGFEFVVVPVASKRGRKSEASGARVLWAWPHQAVNVHSATPVGSDSAQRRPKRTTRPPRREAKP